MARLEGWEKRLFAELAAARHKPYVLGEHDCFRLACRVVHHLTGVDHWPAWGTYRTRSEALRLLASKGHPTFEDAFDWLFGVTRVDVRLARRGDLCCVQTVDGEKHLGVCIGADIALLAPKGLIYTPLPSGRCAWRIG